MKKATLRQAVPATEVVQLALTPEIVQSLTSEVVRTEDVLDSLMPALVEGYSLTLTYDHDKQQYTARLAGVDKACVNAGKLLYANGKSVTYALLAIYGKHFLVAGGGIWASTAAASRDMS